MSATQLYVYSPTPSVVWWIDVGFRHVESCLTHHPREEATSGSGLPSFSCNQVRKSFAGLEVDLNHRRRSTPGIVLRRRSSGRRRYGYRRRQACGRAGELGGEIGTTHALGLERSHAALLPARLVPFLGIAPFPVSSAIRSAACRPTLPVTGTAPLNESFVKSARSPKVC